MNVLHTRAHTAESDGNYTDAAASFFTLGMYQFATEMYRNTRTYRNGVGNLLRSIELDDRAGNEQRATRTAGFVCDRCRSIISEGHTAIVRGLGCEWLADALVMTDNADARVHYERAANLFARLDFETQLHWGNRSAYKHATRALEQFLERREIEYYDAHAIDFAGRIDWKLTMCADGCE
ncbi:hypothetical protein G6M89_05795 [Natronolimnobius sp. AArcel1]|uniref:hypothetical protein n=1 Tax=Natronolimnobius sp. AArcel1 TaxID=1679093 RepID=UPI0013EC204A|nr:hypothetical protein [Natronolimnobius sp. AArcel1]NGM68528.1 hypothetical protein [Natronolimnobius sp. AArcel1]